MTTEPSALDLEEVLAAAQLPALPQSAVRLLRVFQDAETELAEFIAPIESDLGLVGQVLRFVNSSYFESVATLPGIVIDTLNVLPYFPGPNHTKEGGHVGTGRIPSRFYRGNYSC